MQDNFIISFDSVNERDQQILKYISILDKKIETAEAENAELRAEVEKLKEQMEWCRWANECPKSKEGLQAEVERLQTENALLRAELESFYYPRTALLKDLAELDKDEEGE